MADIAMVFHWVPESMDPMEIPELMDWREQARQRHEIKQPRQR